METVVPCNGCKLCCINAAIVLHPEHGDDVSIYQTIDALNPITGMPAKMLDHKPNGDCIYLGDQGCTIYDTRPVLCKGYDCRKQYLSFTKAMRRMLVEHNRAPLALWNAAKARVHTLSSAERRQCIKKRNSR